MAKNGPYKDETACVAKAVDAEGLVMVVIGGSEGDGCHCLATTLPALRVLAETTLDLAETMIRDIEKLESGGENAVLEGIVDAEANNEDV